MYSWYETIINDNYYHALFVNVDENVNFTFFSLSEMKTWEYIYIMYNFIVFDFSQLNGKLVIITSWSTKQFIGL